MEEKTGVTETEVVVKEEGVASPPPETPPTEPVADNPPQPQAEAEAEQPKLTDEQQGTYNEYMRGLSKVLGQNVFRNKPVADLTKAQVANGALPTISETVAELGKQGLLNKSKQVEPKKDPPPVDQGLHKSLLETKVENELLKSNVRPDRLEQAKKLALSDINSIEDIGRVKDIISQVPEFMTVPKAGGETRTSIEVGGEKREKTPGELAVEALRRKNPNGWKKPQN